MKKTKYSIIVISILVVVTGVIFSIGEEKSEAQISRLDVTTIQIDAHTICRNVTNPGSMSFLIPQKTQGEWCSFLKAASALGLTVSMCRNCGSVCLGRCCNSKVWVCNDYNYNPCP